MDRDTEISETQKRIKERMAGHREFAEFTMGVLHILSKEDCFVLVSLDSLEFTISYSSFAPDSKLSEKMLRKALFEMRKERLRAHPVVQRIRSWFGCVKEES